MSKETTKPATTGNPQTTTGTGRDSHATDTKAHAVHTAVHGTTAPMAGPEVSGDKTDQVEEKVISEGHESKLKDGKMTEVTSHIEPTVPLPPAPAPAVGFDPSHPSVDTYPSEDAASEAPGIHVDLTDVVKPVGVVTHAPPPFHRLDGQPTGSSVKSSEGMQAAQHDGKVEHDKKSEHKDHKK